MKFKALVGISAALMAVGLSAVSALAYTTGPGTGGTTTTSNPPVGGSTSATFTFTNSSGQAIAGLAVNFSVQSGTASCVSFNPASGVTNSAGQVSTTVTFSCAGQFTLAAVGAGGETATVTITAGSAFPNTSAAPIPSPVLPIGGIVLGVLLVAGAAFGLSRSKPQTPVAA
jgi:Big-like domain-containing protein